MPVPSVDQCQITLVKTGLVRKLETEGIVATYYNYFSCLVSEAPESSYN